MLKMETSSELDREIDALISNSKIGNDRQLNEQIKQVADSLLTNSEDDPQSEPEEEVGGNDIRNQISKMTMAEKIKTAMFGNSIARGLLIMDPNRMIQEFVLKNPQLRPEEVQDFARNPNTPKNVLRSISEKNTWMKEYPLKHAIVCNPKTPPDISLKWVRFLNQSDLKKLNSSRNIPSVLRQAIGKMLKKAAKR